MNNYWEIEFMDEKMKDFVDCQLDIVIVSRWHSVTKGTVSKSPFNDQKHSKRNKVIMQILFSVENESRFWRLCGRYQKSEKVQIVGRWNNKKRFLSCNTKKFVFYFLLWLFRVSLVRSFFSFSSLIFLSLKRTGEVARSFNYVTSVY
jgi:hypothetical protein